MATSVATAGPGGRAGAAAANTSAIQPRIQWHARQRSLRRGVRYPRRVREGTQPRAIW
ncbi:hypothetical protein XTGART2_1630 [Xanthomonas translucens pv. graminis]|jgi:hypothetical protein|uniref:hypothetical protein n=1 Tax=Xanthomonas graminis TaxID=3390026 RepID=UPI0002E00BA9|nr:hypothetical protein [Xanthomonas translucens]SBV41425.1 hypothetical protein XTGART2_1630 [Xanthomonas translucens pv. graminis]SBV58464.1 hypothetical protein XTGICMP6431_1631 [Xanthomonas translucens pv. graminis]